MQEITKSKKWGKIIYFLTIIMTLIFIASCAEVGNDDTEPEEERGLCYVRFENNYIFDYTSVIAKKDCSTTMIEDNYFYVRSTVKQNELTDFYPLMAGTYTPHYFYWHWLPGQAKYFKTGKYYTINVDGYGEFVIKEADVENPQVIDYPILNCHEGEINYNKQKFIEANGDSYTSIVSISNNGVGTMKWHVSGNQDWISFEQTTGELEAAQETIVTFTIDGTAFTDGQTDSVTITVSSDTPGVIESPKHYTLNFTE